MQFITQMMADPYILGRFSKRASAAGSSAPVFLVFRIIKLLMLLVFPAYGFLYAL